MPNLALKQLALVHPQAICLSSLKMPKPAKIFPVHLLVEPILYSKWSHPENIFDASNPFAQHYPIEEDFLKILVVDQAISCLIKTLTVPVEDLLVFKVLVDKRPEDLFETLISSWSHDAT